MESPVQLQAQIDFQQLISVISPFNMAAAEYYSSIGDDRIKNKINNYVAEHIKKYSMTPENIMMDIERNRYNSVYQNVNLAEEVFNQALAELENDE